MEIFGILLLTIFAAFSLFDFDFLEEADSDDEEDVFEPDSVSL